MRIINDIRMDLFRYGVDINGINSLSFILNRKPKRRKINASLLCKMPYKKRDQGSQGYNDEEREAGNSGCMPKVWD